MSGAINVDPDFAAGGATEAVHVHVVGSADGTVDFEAHAKVVVAGILSGSGSVGILDDEVLPAQFADEFGEERSGIAARSGGGQRLTFAVHGHVSIVCVLRDQHAAPGTGCACAGSVVVRVLQRQAVQSETGADGVISQRRQNNREVRLTDNLQDATDTVIDIEWFAGGREPGIGAGEFHNKAGIGIALQTQSAEGVEVRNSNFALQYMDDISVVPDGLSREGFTANDDTVHGVAAEQVAHDQRTLVVTIATIRVIEAG